MPSQLLQRCAKSELSPNTFPVLEIIKNFQSNDELKDEIINLIKPSYVDVSSLIDREYQNNDTIHTLRNKNGDLIAFFMTGNDDIGELRLIYLGLSGVQHGLKNKGLGKQVYLLHLKQYIDEQEVTGKIIFCWGTTATPSAFNAVHHIWDAAYPDTNYNYSKEAADIAELICRKHSYSYSTQEPFVLRSIANNTKYSDAENNRISSYKERIGFTLFERLNVKEMNGDRILLVCKIPNRDKFLKLQSD